MKNLITVLLFSFICSASVYSQLSASNFQSLSSTFTVETGGTVLGSTANDEQVFNNNTTGEAAPQTDIGFPIGFSFFYNGTFYDRFAVNNNGWIMLGNGSFTIGAATQPLSFSTAAGFANIISAMGRDLQGQTGSSLSYKLTGTAPNRVLVVQWLNYRRFNIASGENFNFQVRLKETENSLSFVYGTVTTTNSSTSTSSNPTQVGLRGATNADYKNRTTTTNWAATTAGVINTSTMLLTTTVKPASGLEFKWTQANMVYSSCTTLTADTTMVKKNSINNAIIKMQVVVTGSSSPLSATSFTFTTSGSTSVSDISNAKVWYSGTSSVFTADGQFGSVVNNPNGSFTITGTRTLLAGTNYFWLTYEVPGTAITGHILDAQCNSITIVSARVPTVQSPSGSRTITIEPLRGTFNIGLVLFKLVSGKDLYFAKTTKKVLREFPVLTDNNFSKKPQQDAANIIEGSRRELREVSVDSFMLMDAGVPYTGPACIKVTQELKNRFSTVANLTDVTGIYANITSAFTDINSNGVDDKVTFLFTDEVYSSETFPIALSGLSGSSSINTFTLKPAPGVTPQIVMSSGSSVFKFFDSEYATIDGSNTVGGTTRDLSIISNDGLYSFGVWLSSKPGVIITDITIENCVIKTGENFIGSTPILISDGANSTTAGNLNNITISNNDLEKGRYGMYINGGSTPAGINNLSVTDNLINASGVDAIGYLGIYFQGVNSGLISGNEIGNFRNTDNENDKGIWAGNGSHNIIIEKNKIYNLGYSGSGGYGGHGIYLSANHINAFDTICNNVIYNMYGDGWNYTDPTYYLDNPTGIAFYSSTPQSGISVLNNSINLYGNTLLRSNSASFGIFASTNTNLSVLNNIISNNLGEGSDTAYGTCGIYAQNSITQFAAIDYNNYYINPTGNGVKLLGKISSTSTSTSMDSWRTVTMQDRSSISYNPGFLSNTDLTPDVNSSNSWSINGRGKQNFTAGTDFNGNSRSTTLAGGAPDIGAYEFVPLSQPPSITGIGTFTNGGNVIFIFGGDTVASIIWHGAALPSAISLKYFSGSVPPSSGTGNFGNGYWVFSPTGGTGYTFDISLYWDPASIGTIGGVSNITMANYTSSAWEHYDAAVNTSLRKVTQNGLSKLTTFTIDDGNSPLPVSMLFFNSTSEGRNVLLKWATSNEINNNGFEIEKKSEFNEEWKKIGFITGKGTSNIEVNYEFKDEGLSTGIYNYRLKQIDYAGNFEYFNLNSPVAIGKPLNFSIGQNYPNPSNPKAKIDYQVPFDSKLSIKVFNIQGKEVKTLYDSFSPAGYYSIEFDGSDLASGIYFYRIVSEKYVKTMKLILVK